MSHNSSINPLSLPLPPNRSWLIPTWGVSDSEFLATVGLDSLVAVRVLAFGIALFGPIAFLGIVVILPVNYSQTLLDSLSDDPAHTSVSNLTYVFLRMTISNVPNGSPVLWVHFIFMIVFVFWGCYLILVFYEEHIAMQHTLMAKAAAADAAEAAPGDGGGGGRRTRRSAA